MDAYMGEGAYLKCLREHFESYQFKIKVIECMFKAIGIVKNYKDTFNKIEVRVSSNLVRYLCHF